MKGAIYPKNDITLWREYAQGWNLIISNLDGCDVFKVIYDILSEILPKLNINSAKSSFIQKPIYNNLKRDNIYKYITSYKTFLKIEFPGKNLRLFIPYEHTVYVIINFELDSHIFFEKVICMPLHS